MNLKFLTLNSNYYLLSVNNSPCPVIRNCFSPVSEHGYVTQAHGNFQENLYEKVSGFRTKSQNTV